MGKTGRDEWLASMNELIDGSASSVRRAEFCRLLKPMLMHVPPGRMDAFLQNARAYIDDPRENPAEAVLAPLVQGDHIYLWGAKLRFPSRSDLPTLMEEIIVREEYFIQTEAGGPAPYIIDAGANFGLATYYFHRMLKPRKVLCLEPDPTCGQLLRENVAENGFRQVEILASALSGTSGTATFHSAENNPMAGSLAPRNIQRSTGSVEVPTIRLSELLDETVDLLKLDVEGVEADVLEEAEHRLGQVRNLFCEVHPRPGEVPSLLNRVLTVLERAGFDLHVSRSPWSEAAHRQRPMRSAARVYSLSVFATRQRQ